ncbi:hypothetical protein M0R89_00010 [Halorussus limi]|uniref:Uncharacterized protein n=1 Tax=Halorussus limi TaxID=2938695 RepID=A0A8U0HTX9_9EURY|nr:hypothetical protein [Halorussus limi]UPV74470.1 hypothetical protein M0R89_00010 [Halorussus limi]
MNATTALRPRRGLALPLLVLAVPTLYLVYRDARIGCPPGRTCLELAHLGYAAAGLAAGYLVASGALAVADESALVERSALARLALRPGDSTLAVLGVYFGGLVTYLLASAATTIPGWLDLALTPVGLVVGLPVVIAYAAMTMVGNALGREPSLAFQLGVVLAGLAVTGAWLFVLATGTASLLGSLSPVKVGSR